MAVGGCRYQDKAAMGPCGLPALVSVGGLGFCGAHADKALDELARSRGKVLVDTDAGKMLKATGPSPMPGRH